jgi:methylated-DNA-[protein]-cysteine S-methyltransferase
VSASDRDGLSTDRGGRGQPARAQYALFDTALGPCGVAWTERGLACIQLPESTREQTEERLRARLQLSRAGRSKSHRAPAPAVETTPPDWVLRAAERIAHHLAGQLQVLQDVPLDLESMPPFWRRVYEVARAVPAGRTISYGEVARAAGSPGGARAVGQAMANNPLPIVIPCHRVLAAGNALGGFSAPGGLDIKRRLLEMEGAAPARASR